MARALARAAADRNGTVRSVPLDASHYGLRLPGQLLRNGKTALDEKPHYAGRNGTAAAVGGMSCMPAHSLFRLGVLRHGVGLMPLTIDLAHDASNP